MDWWIYCCLNSELILRISILVIVLSGNWDRNYQFLSIVLSGNRYTECSEIKGTNIEKCYTGRNKEKIKCNEYDTQIRHIRHTLCECKLKNYIHNVSFKSFWTSTVNKWTYTFTENRCEVFHYKFNNLCQNNNCLLLYRLQTYLHQLNICFQFK